MFIDEAIVSLKAGDGGNGCISFRKEKFVPKGGPDGGDGGNGGSVIFVATTDHNTLLDFKYKNIFRAGDGEHGRGSKMYGKHADDIIVKVPVGTMVYDDATNELIADLDANGKKCFGARGGAGGRGNVKFTNSQRRAPKYAELGEIGQERQIRLVLKLIADIGLVGFPNAGKSTILSKISKATPKIADYPFTTLSPNLGVAKTEENKTFVVADIPGIIEGAHEGVGLGNKFLKHIERTRGIVYVIDLTGFERTDAAADLKILHSELKSFSKLLVKKPFIIAANKMDIPDAKENLDAFKKKIKRLKTFKDIKIVELSGYTGKNVDKLLKAMYDLKLAAEEKEALEAPAIAEDGAVEIIGRGDESAIETLGKTYDHIDAAARAHKKIINKVVVKKLQKSEYQIFCHEFEMAVSIVNFKADDAMYYFKRLIKKFLVDKALRKAGVVNGDTIYIQDFVFEYQDDDFID